VMLVMVVMMGVVMLVMVVMMSVMVLVVLAVMSVVVLVVLAVMRLMVTFVVMFLVVSFVPSVSLAVGERRPAQRHNHTNRQDRYEDAARNCHGVPLVEDGFLGAVPALGFSEDATVPLDTPPRRPPANIGYACAARRGLRKGKRGAGRRDVRPVPVTP
jgi:hypothetical protein